MEVTRQVFMSYEEVRLSGITNMFDVRKVQEIALREGYDELFLYLADNIGAYSRFILTGKEE